MAWPRRRCTGGGCRGPFEALQGPGASSWSRASRGGSRRPRRPPEQRRRRPSAAAVARARGGSRYRAPLEPTLGAFEAADHDGGDRQDGEDDCLTGARRRRPWRLGTPATMANGDRGSNQGGEVTVFHRELTRNSTEVV